MNSARTPADQYSPLTIALHWATLLLLAAVYLCIELRVFFPRGSAIRDGLRSWHFLLGIVILVLTIVRLAVRLANSTPPVAPKPPAWQIAAAHTMHLALYLLLIVMPIIGWLMLSAAGKPVPFFGLELPALIGENPSLSKSIKDVHAIAGRIGYGLIVLHAATALYHHYFVRDNTLKRMLPR